MADMFVRSAMLQAMVAVMAADGELGDDEVTLILDTWGPGLSADEVRAEAEHLASGRQLSDFATRLDEDQRRSVLDAARRVAAADGQVVDAEHTALAALAAALGL